MPTQSWASVDRVEKTYLLVRCLVGNENSKCRSVITLGHLFNLPSLIQSFGRLRPNQRSNCVAICCVDANNQQEMGPDLEYELECCGLWNSDVESFVGPSSLTGFYTAHKCRLAYATMALCGVRTDCCGICDNCCQKKNSAITKQQSQVEEDLEKKRRTLKK